MSRSSIDVGDPLGHLPAEVGEVEAVAAAVEHAARGCAPRRGAAGGRSCRASGSSRSPSVRRPRRGRRRAGRRARSAPRGRRGRRTGTTPRTPTAAGRRRASSMAWKNAAYAATSVREASSKSRTGPSVKNTENIVPADWTTCGTPASVSASAAAGLDRVAGGGQVGVDVVGGQPQRGQAGGGGDRVPGQRAGLVDGPLRARAAPSRRRDRRTPRPGSRRPSPCRTSPGRAASPRRRRRGPTGRCGEARKPVITSSLTNSAPCAAQVSARNALKPGSGGTTPMLPGAASVIRQAIRSPCSANAFSTAARSL